MDAPEHYDPESHAPTSIVVYVCPDCGGWSELTVSGHPQHSGCPPGHREAIAVVYTFRKALTP